MAQLKMRGQALCKVQLNLPDFQNWQGYAAMHQPLKCQADFVGYRDFLSVSLSLLASGAGAGQVLESEQGAF